MKTPVILARSDRRSESAIIMPGAISIMQREHTLSPRSVVTSPGGLLPTPADTAKPRENHKVLLLVGSHTIHVKYRSLKECDSRWNRLEFYSTNAAGTLWHAASASALRVY